MQVTTELCPMLITALSSAQLRQCERECHRLEQCGHRTGWWCGEVGRCDHGLLQSVSLLSEQAPATNKIIGAGTQH